MILKANQEKYELWKSEVLFSWQWWLIFILFISLVTLWICLRKKESTQRLLYVGIVVGILSLFLDILGNFFGLWDYQYELIPAAPWFAPWDIVLIPVFITLLIQWKPKISPLIKSVLFAGSSSFIGLPILTFLGFYVPLNWEYYYSFPINLVIYLIGHNIAFKTTRYKQL